MAIPSRAQLLGALAEREFDVLVIGGGITGCGIARDAALRGLSVALVEKDDFASGTSSRSSRLVHGGVRYLETGQLHLVFEASAERHRLLTLAPHLVRPLAFTWPVYQGARISRWKLSAGLSLYDCLALFRNVHPHRRLSTPAVLAVEPALRSEGLVGGARYYDAATDDARLTLANAIGALDAGAVVVNHVAFRRLEAPCGGVRKSTVLDALTAESIQVRSRIVVNAAGPWSDDVLRLEGAPVQTMVRGSKGVHIAVAHDRVANQAAVTFLAPGDGRVMFALPAGTRTIFGTTDSYASESADDVRATDANVDYLLDAANFLFPDARLDHDDVIAAWAGIRPLVANSRRNSVGASREHAITVTSDGVVTITGGKLTTYRIMAADVVDIVMRRLGRRPHHSPTMHVPLPGGDLVSLPAAEAEASREVGDVSLARHLIATHGSNWRLAWNVIGRAPDGIDRIDRAFPYTFGDMRWAVEQELACTLGDLLMRRSRLAFETRDHGRAAAIAVAHTVGPMLGWSDTRAHEELAAYDRDVARLFTIEPADPTIA